MLKLDEHISSLATDCKLKQPRVYYTAFNELKWVATVQLA
jgi:hypothetical protein